ncbi:MAG: hypothetical protein R2728_02875 [Chitinophagales bacterium]
MKFILTITFTFLLTQLNFLQAQTEEPKTKLILNINGVEYKIRRGEELKLDETIENPVLSISLAENKTLDAGAFVFDYPKHFNYGYDESYALKNWTLDGSDFVVMCFEMTFPTPLTDFVNEMVNQFGKKNCVVSNSEMKLGNQIIEGKRIDVSLIGQKLSIDFLEIKSADRISRFIAFQDTLDENGAATEESKFAIEVISNSIQYRD